MPSPLRIAHVSTRLILGGSQENTVLSCEGQAEAGHDVHLVFGPIYGPEGSLLDRVRAFRTADGRAITTHESPHLIRAVHPWHDARAARDLRRLLADLRPDVVHTHSSKAGIIGRWAAWGLRRARGGPVAVVHTIHGPPFHDFQNALVRRGYIAAERFAAKRCHAVVSVADAMTRQYLDAGIGRPEQYTTVYSGMETAPFLEALPGESGPEVRARMGIPADRFIIGTVARLADLKGHDDLLAALGPELRRNPAWAMLWVGDGWRRARLIAAAAAMNLPIAELDRPSSPGADPRTAQVVITGLVPPQRIPGLMRAMDVLVHPSYREGLPRTVPQALLCGVPVVASDADGTPEACIDGRTGRLYPVGDRAALTAAVRWTAEDPARARLQALEGRALCRDRFSSERMVADLQRVYDAVLAGKAPADA